MKQLDYVIFIYNDKTHKTISAKSWRILLDQVVIQWVISLGIILLPATYFIYKNLCN